jgi:protein-arginine kinase activator protein McsA
MKNSKQKNIVLLFSYFSDNTNLLVKYLLDNKAFTDEFITNITNSEFINNNNSINYNFKSINELDNFLMSILLEQENITSLNNKLKEHIEKEEYEKAAKLRDYINRKKT